MYRVLTRSSDGEWSQLYEGSKAGCRLFIRHTRCGRSTIVTRRTLETWRENLNEPRGKGADSL